jgi:peroxiredoxin
MNITQLKTIPLLAIMLLSICCLVNTAIFAEGTGSQLKINQEAPGFVLKDQNGKSHDLSKYKGKVVVLEWSNPTCPFVVRHYKAKTMVTLAKKHANVIWLTIDSSHFLDQNELNAWAKKEGVKVALNDHAGKVGRAYAARTTPHMYVIDQKGRLAYQGAIDNDPYGDKKSPMNYVDQALQELEAGKKVSVAETKAYGCSVKYKR